MSAEDLPQWMGIIDGWPHSPHYWRRFFERPPTVLLDDRIIECVCRAIEGDDGAVVVELHDEAGRPFLADVVLHGGEVIDRVIARRTLHGRVRIVPCEGRPI